MSKASLLTHFCVALMGVTLVRRRRWSRLREVWAGWWQEMARCFSLSTPQLWRRQGVQRVRCYPEMENDSNTICWHNFGHQNETCDSDQVNSGLVPSPCPIPFTTKSILLDTSLVYYLKKCEKRAQVLNIVVIHLKFPTSFSVQNGHWRKNISDLFLSIEKCAVNAGTVNYGEKYRYGLFFISSPLSLPTMNRPFL